MGSSNPGCLKFFNENISAQKNRSPEIINFFLCCLNKWVFQAHRRVPTPHDRCLRTMEKTILQWKPMELGGVPQKIDEYLFWWPIFYVCSSARNWVSSMYKGIYNIRNSLSGVSWMSEVPKLQRFNKKRGPPKWSISFYIVLKKWVFQTHRRVHSTTGVVYAIF